MHSGSFGRADSHSGGLALSAVLHPFIVVFVRITAMQPLPLRPKTALSALIWLHLHCDCTSAATALKGMQQTLSNVNFNEDCPVSYSQRTLRDIVARHHKPYLFGGHSNSCKHCKSDNGTARFCSFEGYGAPPTCPQHEQKLLLDYWIERAAGGSAVASGLLTFSPCKFWPYLRNRTLW